MRISTSSPMITVNPILKLGDPAIHGLIKAQREGCPLGWNRLLKFRKYSRGEQSVQLTEEQKEILSGLLDSEFCDNVCHQILADAADRVEVRRFECPQSDQVQTYLQDWFSQEGLEDSSDEVHYNTLRDGNAVIALNWEPEEKRVCIYLEDWWDGESGVFVSFDEKRHAIYGVKEWKEYNVSGLQERNAEEFSLGVGSAASGAEWLYRRNVWYPDRLERWASTDRINWVIYGLPEDKNRWWNPWLDKDGKTPLGVPYVVFANANRRVGHYGVSEISGGVCGFQDQLNDLQYDMSSAGRMTGFQMLFLAGVTFEIDPITQTQKKPKVGPGQVFHSPNPEARGNAIPAGDLSQLISVYKEKLRAVARMTRTPLHVLGLEWPSGEALLQAEQPAIKKARKNGKRWSRAWSAVAHMSVRISNRFGGTAYEEDITKAKIVSVISDPERRDPLSQSVIVNNLGVRISDEEALQIMGYEPDRAEAILQQREKEQAAAQARQVELMKAQAALAPSTTNPGQKKEKPAAKPKSKSTPTGGPQAQQ